MTLVLLVVLALLWAGLAAFYVARGRGRPWNAYRPRWAWLRAALYVVACFLLSVATGTAQALVDGPVVAPGHVDDPWWLVSTVVLVGFVLVAYPVMWVRLTVTLDRPASVPTSTLFGLLWGLAAGQLFLVVWRVVSGTGLATWAACLLAYAVIGGWQFLWHSMYWDFYVTPEHDTARSIMIKTVAGHVPNLALSLAYLAVWGDLAVVLAVQVVALVSAAIGMHLPPPWAPDSVEDLAHRTEGRFPRVTGHRSRAGDGTAAATDQLLRS